MTGRGGDSFGFDDAMELELRHRAKRELRKRMRSVRTAVPAQARQARSSRIADRVRHLEAWSAARMVAGYVAMRGEADPAALLEEARAAGRAVVLPRVDWESETMHMHRVDTTTDLEESGMGFLQPRAEAPRVDAGEIELVLVPALAADDRGYRIGWGKGFYDRLLPLMRRASRVCLVFDFQLVAEVPNTPGDERVDHLVTDERTLHVHRPPS